jgi:hypothetical protein
MPPDLAEFLFGTEPGLTQDDNGSRLAGRLALIIVSLTLLLVAGVHIHRKLPTP